MIPRIRNVKPEVFMHELLWELEMATELPIIRCYIALWCMCDREGRFEWKPRVLKQHCAPYDDIDFADVLNALANTGFIIKYIMSGRLYGWTPRFREHQHINNREQESRLPAPDASVLPDYEQRRLLGNFHAFNVEHVLDEAPILGNAVATGPQVATDRPSGPAPRDLSSRLKPTYVYYARDGAHVKIGLSRNPWARLALLATIRPAIILAGVERGGSVLERERHAQFRLARVIDTSQRRGREWFHWTDEIAAHVATLGKSDAPPTTSSRSLAESPATSGSGADVANALADNDLTRDVTRTSRRSTELDRTEQNRTEPNALPAMSSSAAPTAAASMIDQKPQALPAVRGKRTAKVLLERMSAVMSELHEGSRQRLAADQLLEMQAEFIFTYWANKFDHLNTLADDKRLRQIKARLRENGGDVGELLYALDGAKHDKHLMGENERNTVYDGVQTLFRDRAIVERCRDRMKAYREGREHPMLAKWRELVISTTQAEART